MLDENLRIIARRWPALARKINQSQLPDSIEVVDAPQKTIIVNGIQLSSRYDRQREARLQSGLIPEGSKSSWVYGVGTGDVIRALLIRLELESVNVVVMNFSVLHASLTHLDHTDWLDDSRINLVAAETQEDIQVPFVSAPACLYLAEDCAARIRDMVQLELATPHISKKHSDRQLELLQQIEVNKPFWRKDKGVSDALSQMESRQVVIAGAGATLIDSYDWLKQRRAEFSLFAVDAAIQPLFKQGIIPDVVFSIDSYPGIFDLFYRGLDLQQCKNVSLVYFPQVQNALLNRWRGPRLLAYSNHDLYQHVELARPGNRLFSSGSVIHSAVDMAVLSGAKRILLCGADFSFTKDVHRVDLIDQDCPPLVKEHWVLNGRGERVWTGIAYRGYLRDLERYIAWHKEIEFINCSDEGALIAGTDIVTDGELWGQ